MKEHLILQIENCSLFRRDNCCRCRDHVFRRIVSSNIGPQPLGGVRSVFPQVTRRKTAFEASDVIHWGIFFLTRAQKLDSLGHCYFLKSCEISELYRVKRYKTKTAKKRSTVKERGV